MPSPFYPASVVLFFMLPATKDQLKIVDIQDPKASGVEDSQVEE